LVSAEMGARRPTGKGIAIFALIFFVLFDCARAACHAQALGKLESSLYEGQPPLQAAALPNPYTPLRWRGVVEAPNDYRLMNVDAFEELNPDTGQRFFKPAMSPRLESAKRTEAFRFFLYFSRFPVWSEEPVPLEHGSGTRIDLVDLRFGVPGAGGLHCIALEDGRNRVLGSWFTYGSGAQLGWGNQPR
jgi:hypothetical protein